MDAKIESQRAAVNQKIVLLTLHQARVALARLAKHDGQCVSIEVSRVLNEVATTGPFPEGADGIVNGEVAE